MKRANDDVDGMTGVGVGNGVSVERSYYVTTTRLSAENELSSNQSDLRLPPISTVYPLQTGDGDGRWKRWTAEGWGS
jgi:hypothetical protein